MEEKAMKRQKNKDDTEKGSLTEKEVDESIVCQKIFGRQFGRNNRRLIKIG